MLSRRGEWGALAGLFRRFVGSSSFESVGSDAPQVAFERATIAFGALINKLCTDRQFDACFLLIRLFLTEYVIPSVGPQSFHKNSLSNRGMSVNSISLSEALIRTEYAFLVGTSAYDACLSADPDKVAQFEMQRDFEMPLIAPVDAADSNEWRAFQRQCLQKHVFKSRVLQLFIGAVEKNCAFADASMSNSDISESQVATERDFSEFVGDEPSELAFPSSALFDVADIQLNDDYAAIGNVKSCCELTQLIGSSQSQTSLRPATVDPHNLVRKQLRWLEQFNDLFVVRSQLTWDLERRLLGLHARFFGFDNLRLSSYEFRDSFAKFIADSRHESLSAFVSRRFILFGARAYQENVLRRFYPSVSASAPVISQSYDASDASCILHFSALLHVLLRWHSSLTNSISPDIHDQLHRNIASIDSGQFFSSSTDSSQSVLSMSMFMSSVLTSNQDVARISNSNPYLFKSIFDMLPAFINSGISSETKTRYFEFIFKVLLMQVSISSAQHDQFSSFLQLTRHFLRIVEASLSSVPSAFWNGPAPLQVPGPFRSDSASHSVPTQHKSLNVKNLTSEQARNARFSIDLVLQWHQHLVRVAQNRMALAKPNFSSAPIEVVVSDQPGQSLDAAWFEPEFSQSSQPNNNFDAALVMPALPASLFRSLVHLTRYDSVCPDGKITSDLLRVAFACGHLSLTTELMARWLLAPHAGSGQVIHSELVASNDVIEFMRRRWSELLTLRLESVPGNSSTLIYLPSSAQNHHITQFCKTAYHTDDFAPIDENGQIKFLTKMHEPLSEAFSAITRNMDAASTVIQFPHDLATAASPLEFGGHISPSFVPVFRQLADRWVSIYDWNILLGFTRASVVPKPISRHPLVDPGFQFFSRYPAF
jgi:hypothetical protein